MTDESGDNKVEPWELDSLVATLNKRHAVLNYGGKSLILTEAQYGQPDFGRFDDLSILYANNKIPNPNGKGLVSVAKIWLEHKKRRTYPNGITFLPCGNVKGAYNLWKGFAVEPKKGDCSKFLWHCEHVICNGEPERWAYLLGWMAHLIQCPQEKPGVAIVLKGQKGVGKDTFAAVLGKLFPAHYVQVSQIEHITGKFNAQHASALLLHGEEAIWSGNPLAVGPLNSLITSTISNIERKGQDPIQLPSYLRLVLTSNEEWVVPATAGERRYAVYDVSATKKGMSAYFGAIHDQMNDEGGLSALLYFLQNHDLAGFDFRRIPRTEGLISQQLQGLKGPDKWWLETLLAGEFSTPAAGIPNWSKTERYSILCADVYHNYCEWHRSHKYQRDLQDQSALGRYIRKVCPSRQRGTVRLSPASAGTAKGYLFPSLATCRAEFSKALDLPIDWLEMSLELEADHVMNTESDWPNDNLAG